MTKRSNVTLRKYRFGEEPQYDDETMRMSPGERIDLVWQLTECQWHLKDPEFCESRLRRDVASVIRSRG